MVSAKDNPPGGGKRPALTADLLRTSGAERDELHRLACEAARAGSWYVPLDTQECVLSPMAAKLLGLPAQEVVLPAEIWRKRVDSGHLGGLESAVRDAIKADVPFDLEFRASRADGTEYWLYARGGTVRDDQGRPIRVHGAFVDLTAHKKAEEELRRLNETLEHRVAERTAELVEAQAALRQSQKLEAMGQLTGGIAHDFNNLLTPIIANLDQLQRNGPRGEREGRLIGAALKSAESARVLVQRLLAFARRQPLQRVRVDLPSLVAGLEDLITRTLGPKIRVEVDMPEGLLPAHADANQLEMALLNLSVNARDAMPSGGTLKIAASNQRIEAEHGSGLAAGDYVRLTVIDSGIGMDEETRLRAVEPFFSTKSVGEGTGLGLSMAHGLASQLGGALSLSSVPGRGTVVEMWLPVWKGVANDAEAPPLLVTACPRGGTALLVDDHELVRMTTAEMLTELGYEVVQASSAEAAIKLVSGGLRADLVLADFLMPGMTGADLVRLLRGRWPQAAFLLMSGDTGAEGLKPEDVPCLAKPFRKAELQAAIAKVAGTKPEDTSQIGYVDCA